MMQTSKNALTVRVNTTTKENETLLAIITAYVQGEDVAARGRMLLYTFVNNVDSFQNIFEVYLKELKGVVSAIASLQGHLLVSSGPKISLHKWTGTELNVIAFYDAPLYGWKGQKLLSRVEFHAGPTSDCSSGLTSKSTMKSGKLVSNVGNECRPGSKMTSMEDREKLIPRRFKFEEVGAGGLFLKRSEVIFIYSFDIGACIRPP
ncbi:hypothetical protein ZIOFF_018576 [Zingiber officinale]|uniref:RSE1/DDB1/CPSF1 C-terminal domain-containing protein n=1 Tax=Zingiber officinale TaxID=94328 RepID=A0A8J5LB23_ZINOF|nr:hypothetical protein ZIOFF_018576 [Zingiber officinale]